MPGMERAEPERTLTSSGSLASPSFLPVSFFEAREVLGDFRAQLVRILLVVLEIVIAGFRGDREAGGNGQADARHLGEAGALAAEQVLHVAVPSAFPAPKK